jgi:hypothetical protein
VYKNGPNWQDIPLPYYNGDSIDPGITMSSTLPHYAGVGWYIPAIAESTPYPPANTIDDNDIMMIKHKIMSFQFALISTRNILNSYPR